MDDSPMLFLRSDGFWELSGGFVAVKMKVKTGCSDNLCWFEFKPTILGDIVRVEWDSDHPLQLFPENVAAAVIRMGYARQPIESEIQWMRAMFAPPPPASADAPTAPESAPPAAISPPLVAPPAPLAPAASDPPSAVAPWLRNPNDVESSLTAGAATPTLKGE